jgi:hypothetical protein
MPHGFMPVAGRLAGLSLAAWLTLAAPLGAAEDYPGFTWMSGAASGDALLIFGSPETGEDYLFNLICRNKDKSTGATLYVDIAGSKVGQKATIELAAGTKKLPLDGKIATDEMSGFHFAEAKGFKIKPVIALLQEKGPITAKTGKVVSALPEKGRAAKLSEFAKACKLD